MPLRSEAEFLRERARRLREITATETQISRDILAMADELEHRAGALEHPIAANQLNTE